MRGLSGSISLRGLRHLLKDSPELALVSERLLSNSLAGTSASFSLASSLSKHDTILQRLAPRLFSSLTAAGAGGAASGRAWQPCSAAAKQLAREAQKVRGFGDLPPGSTPGAGGASVAGVPGLPPSSRLTNRPTERVLPPCHAAPCCRASLRSCGGGCSAPSLRAAVGTSSTLRTSLGARRAPRAPRVRLLFVCWCGML